MVKISEKTKTSRIQMLVDALRSQKYPQCAHTMHQGKAHCAAGIAEVVYCIEKGITTSKLAKSREERLNDTGTLTAIHPDMLAWYGVSGDFKGLIQSYIYDRNMDAYHRKDVEVDIVTMNDAKGLSFDEIGRAIARKYIRGEKPSP